MGEHEFGLLPEAVKYISNILNINPELTVKVKRINNIWVVKFYD